MAILLVDDEANTRQALRGLLERIGCAPILEAKNGEEALRVIQSQGSRVRMIVADWEMPYMDGITFLGEVAKLPQVGLAPFLLITSDLPASALEELHRTSPRLDEHLFKPFRGAALADALARAAAHRARARDVIVFWGSDESAANLTQALASGKAGHWRELRRVRDATELEATLSELGARAGGVALDPHVAAREAKDVEALSQSRKSPIGAATAYVCLAREAEAVRPVRTLCQWFVEPKGDWGAWLREISERMAHSWELELLSTQAKAALQAGKPKDAGRACERLVALDPTGAESRLLAAEARLALDDRRGALEQLRQAVAANPCLPRAYIRLFELLPQGEGEAVAQAGRAYCPGNADVLLAVARWYRQGGELPRARELAEQALAAAPGHAGAQQLVKELGEKP